MRGGKFSVQRIDVAPARLALLKLTQGLTAAVLVGWLWGLIPSGVPGWTSLALAQAVPNEITNLAVSPTGDLIITVAGEGFDPLLRLEPAAHGSFHIVVEAPGVTLAPGLAGMNAHLGPDFHLKIPAIEGGKIASLPMNGVNREAGVQVILTAWRKVQPQILSNDGHQIVITFIGPRSLPAAMVTRQRVLAEQARPPVQNPAEEKRVALQHQQAEQRKHEAQQKAQAQLEKQAARAATLSASDPPDLLPAPPGPEPSRNSSSSARQSHRFGSITPRTPLKQASPPHTQVAGIKPATAKPGLPVVRGLSPQASAAPSASAAPRTPNPSPSLWASPGPAPAPSSVQTVYQSYAQPEEVQYEAELEQEQLALATRRLEAQARQRKLANAGLQTIAAASPDTQNRPDTLAQLQVANLAAKPNPISALAHHAGTGAQKPYPHGLTSDHPPLVLPSSKALAQVPGSSQVGSQRLNLKPLSPVSQPETFTTPQAFKGAVSAEPAPFSWLGPTQRTALPVSPASAGQPVREINHAPPSLPDETIHEGEDNGPTSPLRLTKPPEGVIPEPGATAFPLPGADAGRAQSIYAVMRDPAVNPTLSQAWDALMEGDASKAQARLRERLQQAPDDVQARYLLAQILLTPLGESPTGNASPALAGEKASRAQQARRDEAQAALLKNYQQARHWPSAQALLELYLDEGKLEPANRLLTEVSQAYPHEAGVFYEQGRLQEALVDLDAARKAYQQALALQPTHPEVHYRLAQVELKSGHLETARWELLQALSWSPNDSRMIKLLGYIADRTGQPSQAAEAYRQALPIDALINYARTLEAGNEPERALSLYQAAETLAGDNSEILYNLAMIYTDTHRTARASAVLQRFLSLRNNPQDTRVRKAYALLKQLDPTP